MGRPRRQITDAQRERVRKLAADGMSINRIASTTDLSWPMVRGILNSAGGKSSRPAKNFSNGAPKPNGASADYVELSVELLDRIWSELPAEKKVAALNSLYVS